MKRFWNGCMIAFSLFTRLPVPQIEWKDENLKYVFCFYPVIGAVIGGLSFFVFWLLQSVLAADKFLTAAILAVLPVLVTGGIHLDGFCDVSDAIASRQPMERKLEILKDSNAGAFAVIQTVLYFVMYVALLYALPAFLQPLYCLGFSFIRSLAGLAILCLKPARPNGMLRSLTDPAKKGACLFFLVFFALLSVGASVWLEWKTALCAVCGVSLFTLYYKGMCRRHFGGITGDTSGWLIQTSELLYLGILVGAERIFTAVGL